LSVDVIDDAKITEMRDAAKTEADEGAKDAEAADFPDVSTAAKNVYGNLEVV
jgi:TPP-dependent pyruvate/acetoin dehydrogenase alpha subunit